MESSYVDKASLVRWRDEEGSKTNAIAAKFSFLVAAITLVLEIKERHCVFHAALEIIGVGFSERESTTFSCVFQRSFFCRWTIVNVLNIWLNRRPFPPPFKTKSVLDLSHAKSNVNPRCASQDMRQKRTRLEKREDTPTLLGIVGLYWKTCLVVVWQLCV